MTTALTVRSHAKLNWYLRVLDPRPDGYHDLETIFETLELADTLRFTPLDAAECRISGFPPDVPAERNLITRAWQVLREEFPERVRGLQVEAEKTLPRGGGLGGGSSNAAAALLALDRLYGLSLPTERLVELGARLGSDVAFFVMGGCAVATGRGEILTPLEAPGEFHLVLVLPDEPVPTGEAYARLDAIARPAPAAALGEAAEAVKAGDPVRLARLIVNDFELVVVDRPWFRKCCEALREGGALRAFLCGSGSTVAGLAENQEGAAEILRHVHESCPYPAYHTTARALSLIR